MNCTGETLTAIVSGCGQRAASVQAWRSNPFAELHDDAALLGYSDEDVGLGASMSRPVPVHQCLVAADAAAAPSRIGW